MNPTVKTIVSYVTAIGVIAIVVFGVYTFHGKKVSQVFSQIHSGLTTGDSTGDSYEYTHAPAVTYSTESSDRSAKLSEERSVPEAAGMRETPVVKDENSSAESTATTARPRPQGRPAPIKAGEIDDNDQSETYLDYLATYQGQQARLVDIRERYNIAILGNNQHPLVDAHVSVYDGEQQVFEARTFAGGKTLFLPGALSISANATQFRLVAEYGENRAETSFNRNEKEEIEMVLPNAISSYNNHLDVLFLLDTTGSMSDELSQIQETIDSIAQRIDSFEPRPELRFGVVAYRDRGDAYVTRSYDFTADVATFRTLLNGFSADGGGDTPESLNEALHEAVQNVQWADDAIRLIFLVGDAGPHLDYAEDYDYVDETQAAIKRGIKIYPIAASNTDEFAEYVFRQLAQQTLSHFIFLTYQPGQSEGVPGESTTLQSGEQPYTVDSLDDIIVNVVQYEMAKARGIE
jgi:hypothetical protein